MDVLYLLIPISAVLVLGIVAVFGWAVHAGQFDDVEREGERLLQNDSDPLDEGQPAGDPAQEKSRAVSNGMKAGGLG
jgi:cbb3-type cytochrome oxidase maturation protein